MYVEHTEYSLDTILQEVSWYWLTKSYGRSLWSYRSVWRAVLRDDNRKLPSPLAIQKKPLGYSWYPGEVLAAAKSWLEHWFPDNLVFYRAHESVRLLSLLTPLRCGSQAVTDMSEIGRPPCGFRQSGGFLAGH